MELQSRKQILKPKSIFYLTLRPQLFVLAKMNNAIGLSELKKLQSWEKDTDIMLTVIISAQQWTIMSFAVY